MGLLLWGLQTRKRKWGENESKGTNEVLQEAEKVSGGGEFSERSSWVEKGKHKERREKSKAHKP